jgi:uncharacterized protein YciW
MDLRKEQRSARLKLANRRLREYFDYLRTLTTKPEEFLVRATQELEKSSASPTTS